MTARPGVARAVRLQEGEIPWSGPVLEGHAWAVRERPRRLGLASDAGIVSRVKSHSIEAI